MGLRIHFLLLCFFIAFASAQLNGQFPNGQFQNGQFQNSNCGTCAQGLVRGPPPGPYGCGKCEPITQSCMPGTYRNGNTCQTCPCPGSGNGNPFGTTCYVDKNGEVCCNCAPNYAGRDCSTCAPGCIQDPNFPNSCIRPNNTCSGPGCPQILPPAVVQPPPGCGTNCGANCGTGNCAYPQPQPQPWPVPQPQPWPVPQPQPWPGPVPAPQPQPQPQPCPVPNCPAPGNCAPNCPNGNCGSNCPQNCGNNCGGQIIVPGPGPQPQCPTIPSCPQCPSCPQQCPQCPGCPQTQCPDCNCAPCNNQPCAQCPSPCQPCPPQLPCNNCPNPCQPCPSLTCGNNVTCPSPCPSIPPCPACNATECGCEIGSIRECCDPRGKLPDLYGRCVCKENVEGHTCSICKPGYFGISEFNPSGCSKCFGSGVTDYCKSAVLYRTTLQISSGEVFQIAEMTSDGITVIDAITSTSGTASKTFGFPRKTKLLWVLPAQFLGNRLTSYGGRLSCSRRYSGAVPLGSDHDVIIVGARGGVIYWSSFSSPAILKEETFSALLSERGAWVVSQDGSSRPARRADILFVLAEVQAIYVRASFSATTSSTVIRDCKLDSVSESVTSEGLILEVEQCRCPPGYKGLSCESCSHGYYRDISDTGRCVFGACKKCPCGPHADGCRYELGAVICICRAGYSGPLCQDREYLTITMDPFRIKEIINTVVQFNCSYITNSKRQFTLAITTVPPGLAARVETTSTTVQSAITLTKDLNHVICTLTDITARMEVAWVKSTVVIDIGTTTVILPPPPLVSIIATTNFICVNETDPITDLNCTVVAYGLNRVNVEWRRETENGTEIVSDYDLRDMRRSAKLSHTGAYICSASVGNITALERIAIVVLGGIVTKNNSRSINLNSWRADDPNVYNDTGSNVLTTTEDPKKLPADSNILPEKRPEGFPTINIEPSQLKVKVGEPATLKCEAKGKAPLKYYWKSGKTTYIPHHVRAAHGSLMFQAVTKDDEGDYFCVAWNELGQSSAIAKLIVLDGGKTAFNSTLTVSPSEVTGYPGENINFQCTIRDTNARIIWTKKDGVLPTSSEVKGDGILTLYRVSTPNEGVYICSTVLPNGKTIQAEGKLTVSSNTVSIIPTIKLQPRSPHKVRSGERVLLDCQSSGEPTPTVTWSRSIEGKEEQLVVSATPSSIHEIPHVTKADEGKYTCTASNKAGTKLESLSLMVDDAIICKGAEFRCKSGDQCVSKDDRCDGERDCKDGSDEHHCRRSKL